MLTKKACDRLSAKEIQNHSWFSFTSGRKNTDEDMINRVLKKMETRKTVTTLGKSKVTRKTKLVSKIKFKLPIKKTIKIEGISKANRSRNQECHTVGNISSTLEMLEVAKKTKANIQSITPKNDFWGTFSEIFSPFKCGDI